MLYDTHLFVYSDYWVHCTELITSGFLLTRTPIGLPQGPIEGKLNVTANSMQSPHCSREAFEVPSVVAATQAASGLGCTQSSGVLDRMAGD